MRPSTARVLTPALRHRVRRHHRRQDRVRERLHVRHQLRAQQSADRVRRAHPGRLQQTLTGQAASRISSANTDRTGGPRAGFPVLSGSIRNYPAVSGSFQLCLAVSGSFRLSPEVVVDIQQMVGLEVPIATSQTDADGRPTAQ